MAVLKNDFEAQTAGVSATNANSATSGFALSFNRGTSSTTVYDGTHPGHGTLGIKMHSAASAACAGNVTVTSTAQIAAQRSVCFDTFPSTGRIRVMTIGSILFCIRSTGALETFNAAGSVINTSTGLLTAGQVYRLEMFVKKGTNTTNGTIKFKACPLGDDTPVANTEFAATNVNAGTANMTSLSFGNNGTEQGAIAVDDYMDDLAYDIAATTYIGAATYGPVSTARALPLLSSTFQAVNRAGVI